MADHKGYIKSADEKGSISISEEVIAVIAGSAAIEVEGVHGLFVAHGKDITNMISKKGLVRGVRLHIEGDDVTIDVYIMADVGCSVSEVKRKFRRQDTILQGVFPNVNIVVGSACEPGCRVLVRMALDACKVSGLLQKLQRPLTIFTGRQFEPYLDKVEGDIIVYGDCAKKMLDFYPKAKFWGSTEEFPNRTPVWSNRPGFSLVEHIESLTK